MEPASPEALVPAYGLWPWLAAAAVLALVAVVIAVWLAKRKPAAANLPSLRRAALADAESALETLSPESSRETATLGSLILRKYLSVAAGDPALFETHEEFVSRRDSLHALTPEARAAAEAGFTRLASLKYAPEIPDDDPQRIIADCRVLLEALHRGFAA